MIKCFFMEELVFKKVRTKKVWMKAEYNSISNFFEEASHSLFSAFHHLSISYLIPSDDRVGITTDQASSLLQESGDD